MMWFVQCHLATQQRLYRQCFPGGPHPSRQVIEKTVKRFRETGSVTHKSRIGSPRNVGERVQPEDTLAYILDHPQSSTRETSEQCSLTKSHIWTILNKVGAHPYLPTSVQALIPGDGKRS